MTQLIDVKALEAQAKSEIAEQLKKEAVVKLKELYLKKEKAELVVRNIETEIARYLADVSNNVVYSAAGVDK